MTILSVTTLNPCLPGLHLRISLIFYRKCKFTSNNSTANPQTESNVRKLRNLRFAEVFVEVPITGEDYILWATDVT